MKKIHRTILGILIILTLMCTFCGIAMPVSPILIVKETFFWENEEVTRVYKFEISSHSTDEQKVKFLTQRFMNTFRFGSLGWYQWYWTYKINKIEINGSGTDKSVFLELDILPVFRGGWDGMSENIDLGNGWLRTFWYFGFKDMGLYYVLTGPYSGG